MAHYNLAHSVFPTPSNPSSTWVTLPNGSTTPVSTVVTPPQPTTADSPFRIDHPLGAAMMARGTSRATSRRTGRTLLYVLRRNRLGLADAQSWMGILARARSHRHSPQRGQHQTSPPRNHRLSLGKPRTTIPQTSRPTHPRHRHRTRTPNFLTETAETPEWQTAYARILKAWEEVIDTRCSKPSS